MKATDGATNAPPSSSSASGRKRPSPTNLPAAPGASRPPVATAPRDEPDDMPMARSGSRRTSALAPWDEPEDGPQSRAGSRRPSATAPCDEPDDIHSFQQKPGLSAPGSRPGSRRPSTCAPWDEPDEGHQPSPGEPPRAAKATAPWDEPDAGGHSSSDSDVFKPAPRARSRLSAPADPKSASKASGLRPSPRSEASQQSAKARQASPSPASAPAPVQNVQLNGKAPSKAKSPAAKSPRATSPPAKSPHAKAKPEPRENPAVQVPRFDFSVFDFLRHEALRTPSPQDMFADRSRGDNAVGGEPPVMLGAMPAATFAGFGDEAPAPKSKAPAGNKVMPPLNLGAVQQSSQAPQPPSNHAPMVAAASDSSGSEVWDPVRPSNLAEVRSGARQKQAPPQIAGTPGYDDGQESLDDDDWPPRARRSTTARLV